MAQLVGENKRKPKDTRFASRPRQSFIKTKKLRDPYIPNIHSGKDEDTQRTVAMLWEDGMGPSDVRVDHEI